MTSPAMPAPWPGPQPGMQPPGQAARGRPPATVRLAQVALLVAAVLALLPVVSAGYDLSHLDDLLRRAAETTAADPDEVASARSFTRGYDITIIILSLVVAAGVAVPALFLRRGSSVARVLSCVAAGALTLCCCTGLGLATFAANSAGNGSSELEAEVMRLQERETPAWVQASAIPLLLVPLLALGGLVLLVVPASNRFFRRTVDVPVAWPGGGAPPAGYQTYAYYPYPQPTGPGPGYPGTSGWQAPPSGYAWPPSGATSGVPAPPPVAAPPPWVVPGVQQPAEQASPGPRAPDARAEAPDAPTTPAPGAQAPTTPAPGARGSGPEPAHDPDTGGVEAPPGGAPPASAADDDGDEPASGPPSAPPPNPPERPPPPA